jgi:hypothetical protein
LSLLTHPFSQLLYELDFVIITSFDESRIIGTESLKNYALDVTASRLGFEPRYPGSKSTHLINVSKLRRRNESWRKEEKNVKS